MTSLFPYEATADSKAWADSDPLPEWSVDPNNLNETNPLVRRRKRRLGCCAALRRRKKTKPIVIQLRCPSSPSSPHSLHPHLRRLPLPSLSSPNQPSPPPLPTASTPISTACPSPLFPPPNQPTAPPPPPQQPPPPSPQPAPPLPQPTQGLVRVESLSNVNPDLDGGSVTGGVGKGWPMFTAREALSFVTDKNVEMFRAKHSGVLCRSRGEAVEERNWTKSRMMERREEENRPYQRRLRVVLLLRRKGEEV